MKHIYIALAGLSLAVPTASAQQAQDILRRTAEVYQDIGQYRFDVNVSMKMTGGGEQHALDLDLVIAAREPDGMRIDVEGPNVALSIISDGDSTWTYMPLANQYMATAGGLDPKKLGASIPDILGEYTEIEEGARKVEVLREETVQLGGESRPAFVVQVEYESGEGPAKADSTWKTLWIDKERGLVLRDDTRAYVSRTPFGVPMYIDETTRFNEISIGEPLEEALFAFRAPADAVRVEPEPAPAARSHLRGQEALNFELEKLDGGTISLESLRGKVVLVNFWATWCGPCRVEMPMLERVYREYGDKGLEVIAVSVGESREEVEPYIEENGYSFPILLDSDSAVGNAYRTTNIPTSFIIDRNGIIVHHFVGVRPEQVLIQALKDAGLE